MRHQRCEGGNLGPQEEAGVAARSHAGGGGHQCPRSRSGRHDHNSTTLHTTPPRSSSSSSARPATSWFQSGWMRGVLGCEACDVQWQGQWRDGCLLQWHPLASRVCNPQGAHTANLGPPPSPYPQSSPRVPAVDRLRAAQISSASRIGLPTQAPISAPLPLIF